MFPICNWILSSAFALTPNVNNLKSADDVRLTCAIPTGDVAQVQVVQRGEQFFLLETPYGGNATPPLEREVTDEWKSQEITLSSKDAGTTTKLWKTPDNQWMIDINSNGWFESAPADCF